MPAKRGPVILYRGDGQASETFVKFGSLRSATVSINGNSIDVTTADDIDGNDVIWMNRINGPKDFGVQGSGISKTQGALDTVEDDFLNDRISNYRVQIPNGKTYTIPMIVSNIEFTGEYNDVISFSINLESAGAPISVT